jgi:hypothetical protein
MEFFSMRRCSVNRMQPAEGGFDHVQPFGLAAESYF